MKKSVLIFCLFMGLLAMSGSSSAEENKREAMRLHILQDELSANKADEARAWSDYGKAKASDRAAIQQHIKEITANEAALNVEIQHTNLNAPSTKSHGGVVKAANATKEVPEKPAQAEQSKPQSWDVFNDFNGARK